LVATAVAIWYFTTDYLESAEPTALSFGVPIDLDDGEWPVVGGDTYGAKYSPLSDIDPTNVAGLQIAWTYQTGEAGVDTRREPRLAATPIVLDGETVPAVLAATKTGKQFVVIAAGGGAAFPHGDHIVAFSL
jgi:glucose dehydrogenase